MQYNPNYIYLLLSPIVFRETYFQVSVFRITALETNHEQYFDAEVNKIVQKTGQLHSNPNTRKMAVSVDTAELSDSLWNYRIHQNSGTDLTETSRFSRGGELQIGCCSPFASKSYLWVGYCCPAPFKSQILGNGNPFVVVISDDTWMLLDHNNGNTLISEKSGFTSLIKKNIWIAL